MYARHSGTTAERQKLRNKHRRERSEVLADRRIFKTLSFIADEDARGGENTLEPFVPPTPILPTAGILISPPSQSSPSCAFDK
ncbi:hypothetical protein CEXT_160041 [Caerostris extrusa]|uniref:Uncharacterized protein n=1 Tax=Caerostris extrusa TaxID=172846 RepID=A0AAV4NG85_CAEEX|nr:hypothetical protein CEXT_160041 [Caerostris extrusa]